MSGNPNPTLLPMVHKLSLWMQLDDEDKAAILSLPHRVRKFGSMQYIVRDGEKPTHSCLLLAGFAFRHKVSGDGGRQIMSIHMKGDVVDLQNSLLRTSDHNVQALTNIEVALIPVEVVQDIAFKRPNVGRAMWYETLVDGSIFREWTLNVGRRDAVTRTAHLLCEFALRLESAGLGEQCAYELPMTQEQLADALGLTSVHVNRPPRERRTPCAGRSVDTFDGGGRVASASQSGWLGNDLGKIARLLVRLLSNTGQSPLSK